MYEMKTSVDRLVPNQSDTQTLTSFFGLLLEWYQKDNATQENNDANAYKQTQTCTAQIKRKV
jgi:hypothetical protein